MICPNCNEMNDDNEKFCGNCGTKLPEIPKTKKCPECNAESPVEKKFCGNCGYNFEGNTKPAQGSSIGDRNNIVGSVLGNKEETNITGNATIIKNQDESKKTEKCHVCGSMVLQIEGYYCPSCGEFTCNECYDKEKNKCKSCITQSGNEKEDVYRQALIRALEDERIDMAERKELMALQGQLGISAMRAMELEKLVKSELAEGKCGEKTVSLSTFDKITLDKAVKLLYEEGNAEEAEKILEPLFAKYSMDENVLELYLNSMVKTNPDKVLSIIKNLQADILCSYLAEIDVAFNKEDYSTVEEKLSKAEKFWADSGKLKSRQARFYLALSKVSGDSSYIMLAKEILDSCGDSKDKLERTVITQVNFELLEALNETVPDVTDEYCDANGIYKSFFTNKGYSDEVLDAMNLEELLALEKDNHNAKVQYFIYERYRRTENDLLASQAFKYAELSAAQNYTYGVLALARCYIQGRGVSNVSNETVEEQKKIVEEYCRQGNVLSYNIKSLYVLDENESYEYVKKAIELNWPEAYENLANYYYYGCEGITDVDYPKAFENYKIAADKGLPASSYQISMMYRRGRGVDKNLDKAFEYAKKSAEDGYKDGQNLLGVYYYAGIGTTKDFEKSVYWFKKAVEQGHIMANQNLAEAYEKGEGIEINEAKAREHYLFAAENHLAVAQIRMGTYCKDEGDYIGAENWYLKAAEKSDNGLKELCWLYYEYKYQVNLSFVQRVEWYKKAVDKKFAIGYLCLGLAYVNSEGVIQNIDEGKRLLEAGTELDDDQSVLDCISSELTQIMLNEAKK